MEEKLVKRKEKNQCRFTYHPRMYFLVTLWLASLFNKCTVCTLKVLFRSYTLLFLH